MNANIVIAYQTGQIVPTAPTLRVMGKTRYAVSSCGAWVRITPKPAKKRKKQKPRLSALRVVKAQGTIYAGMTVKDCCTACNADGCVISGKPYCAHPRKGGLHGAEMQDSAAMKRRSEAEKVLGKQLLKVDE